ncbi:MAG: PaaI family thioesterase [Syntrophaceae bacterium]|nr:PaaI family thioesterase [Syntrophaceae bacterium]
MPEINTDHLMAVINVINDCPFFRHMSMRVVELGHGYSVVKAKIGKKHMNPFGGLHGGVYASVIDTAAYWSAYCDLPATSGMITIDLKVDFLAPVLKDEIIIKGERIKSGKTIHLTQASAFSSSGKLLAHGTSKLMVTPDKQSIQNIVEYAGLGKLPQKFIQK